MKRIVPIATTLPLTVVVLLLLWAENPAPQAALADTVSESLSDLHHSLYGTVASDPTSAPNATPGERLVCLSCHAVDTSSGHIQFHIVRDCLACHGGGNEAPVADPNGPYVGSPGQPIQFDGTRSFDPDGTIVGYLWDFGDGSIGIGPTPTHEYSRAGNYIVSLVVTDNGGKTADAVTTVDIIDNEPGPGSWTVRLPLLQAEFELRLEQFAGVLFVEEVFPDNTILFGVGAESGSFIFWLDTMGALYCGFINEDARTMHGIAFNFPGANSIWFAEQRTP